MPRNVFKPLKADIAKNGIKTALHVLPDYTVICGHQRLKVSNELILPNLPCRTVFGLEDEGAIKEYVIKDNLLRRHLSIDERADLTYELYKLKDKKRGFRSDLTLDHNDPKLYDIYEIIAKELGLSRGTVIRCIRYAKVLENHPEWRGQKITKVLRQVKKVKQLKEVKELKPPEGKFNVIVVDPPWPGTGGYDPNGFRGAGDYPVLNLEEIEAIELPAADDCILWLWGIDLHLKETLEIIEAWGFERKSTLVWVKDKMGLGHWLRNQHEYCFLAIKGKPIFHGEDIPSILHAPRRKHSEKPDEFYKLVEKASPYKAKLDYFGRKKRIGWAVFGDEIK